MKAGMLTVATFSDREKAARVQQKLKESGIAAELDSESAMQRLWFLSKPLANQKVYVPDAQREEAQRVLEAADREENILHGEVRCPKCGSARVEYPQFTRKFLTTTAMETLCLIGMLERKFYCTDCHHMWPVKVKLRPTTDRLNWPEPKTERGLVKKETGGGV